jgi:hypothetical protein
MKSPRQQAYLMIEVLIYIGMVFLLLGIGYMAMYRCINNSVALRHNADDITTVLHAGEHWRADIRSSTGPPRIETSDWEQVIHLPGRDAETLYLYSHEAMFRRHGEGPWVQVLTNIKSSVITADESHATTSLRWELELASRGKPHRIRPLFTFIAVPAVKPMP